MILKVNKDICEIKQNEVWNVGDYNVHTVEVELSDEFNGLVNKVRYFIEDNSYDMLITDNVAQVPYEATLIEGTIKIGVYGYDADTNILVQSTSPVNKYISSGTYTGEVDNTEPLTPTDKQQMESAIQKNADDIINLQNNKQDVLISGENIKTINNESVLGNGNIEIDVGSINYNDLENKPKINNVELNGNKSLSDLGIQPAGNYALESEIPDVSNFITKDVNNLTYYTLSSGLSSVATSGSYNDLINKPNLSIYATVTNLNNEISARENADTNLQNQIDAITLSSDVIDVLGTYQELQNYDTTHVKANDIIKVLQDSTHSNAMSYYRWVITNNNGSWVYVGSEGPYYTKGETDTLLNDKQNVISSSNKLSAELISGLSSVATSGSYNDLSNKPTIPSEVTETTVSNWGFTKNTGTITGITMNGTSKGTSGVVDLGTVITSHQDISGKANKISVVQTSTSTIEINSNTFYKFGEVASLNITLASITDNTIYNEYMFEFISGSTATTLTLPSSIKWLETPTIDANKIYQCSIVDNIGLLVGVTNV